MSKFGSTLEEWRKRKGYTQKKLSELLGRRGHPIHFSVLSRWETGSRQPQVSDREVVIALGEILIGSEEGKNQLLTQAGLLPLQLEELNLDKLLDGLGPERWRKTRFLHEQMKWDEEQIGEKLGIAFWEVRQDLREAETKKEVEVERGRLLDKLRHLDPRWQRHVDEVQNLVEHFARELKLGA